MFPAFRFPFPVFLPVRMTAERKWRTVHVGTSTGTHAGAAGLLDNFQDIRESSNTQIGISTNIISALPNLTTPTDQ